MINKKEFKVIKCECGRTKHYKDAKYCGNCGKKLKQAAKNSDLSK